MQAVRAMIGHNETQWVNVLLTVNQWLNTTFNRDTGTTAQQYSTGIAPSFDYGNIAPALAARASCNDIGNLMSSINDLARVCAAVSCIATAQEFERELVSTPTYADGAQVMIHFPVRIHKLRNHFRGPFTVRSHCKESPSYYYVTDNAQPSMRYLVHVRRMKAYDASRSSDEIEAAHGSNTIGTGLVTRVVSHARDLISGYMEFTVEFATGHLSVLPWSELKKLDLVLHYVATHKVDTHVMPAPHRKLWLQGIEPATNAKAKRSPP